MSHITTHVLDTSNGIAGQSIYVELYQQQEDSTSWKLVGSEKTNQDGRCSQLYVDKQDNPLALVPGTFKLVFHIKDYFIRRAQTSFFPIAEITFDISNPPSRHYHVPLLLSHYSYTTYRGT